MRIFRVLPALALFAGARASSLDGRAPVAHPLDTRDVLDICAAIDVELTVPGILGISIPVGLLDVCLCLSALPVFLETNVVAIAAVAIAGHDEVTAILTALINTAAPKAHCTYPEHGTPICDGKNPCGFQCKDGFTPSPPSKPTTCVCAAPSVVCNGVCGPAKSCPTSKPLSKREKRWQGSGACNDMGEGWMACGVFGGAGRAWECLNTDQDLESCGGCVLPLTPYTPVGIDCTALPGVADVSCSTGSCVVFRCLSGYKLARDSSHCIPNKTFSPAVSGLDSAPPAIQYGLEHVPLKH
ncbi:hypothetical protein FA95DRAFT_1491411 [Auriscalpium vulgare]|uniref:Uncharacterized protein n=1 Tax=Auriscalpium vulgare TaxID=40419 RepID=A0ACB8RV85_9AGAM|nr:hypothetical protein FA95DRAFT_1491411 [Auriscalpium vulgare]